MTYSLGHTNAGVLDSEGLILFVGDNVDAKVLARIELTRVRESLIPDLVESIRAVRHQLSQEDLLVGVDGVDDEREELRDLSLELKGLASHG